MNNKIIEHPSCHSVDNLNKPQIETVSIPKGTRGYLELNHNEVAFFLEGRLKFIFGNFHKHESKKGQILFLPVGERYFYRAPTNAIVMVFRLHGPLKLCDNYPVEKLYGAKAFVTGNNCKPRKEKLNMFQINSHLWHFLDGINNCLTDGINCNYYFELKIKEFFLLLRTYYTKEEIHDFFQQILTKDTIFSEFVRLNSKRFRTVTEIADAMNLSPKQFAKKFVEIFKETPYQWMKANKAKVIQDEITSTNKPFKQIAYENEFSTIAQFTKFCKKEIGKTPSSIRASVE